MLSVKAMVVGEKWLEKKGFESCCDDGKVWLVLLVYLFGFLQKQSLRQRLGCKKLLGEMTPPPKKMRVMKNIYSYSETGKGSIKGALPLPGSAPWGTLEKYTDDSRSFCLKDRRLGHQFMCCHSFVMI